jgi:ABC-type transporter Mla subunit MlaD
MERPGLRARTGPLRERIMSKERDDKLDPGQPALVVKCGNTKRKYRPLDRDVLILGRAPGCDLGLDAPDVALVHCLIVKAPDGWRVRDCTGRGGTRLNGKSVQDGVLGDEDVLQVGSFSFVLHLPSSQRTRAPDSPHLPAPHLGRMERSRRNLAQLALRLRARLAKAASVEEGADELLAERQVELDLQAEELRRLQDDLDARLDGLKRTAQEVAANNKTMQDRRQALEKELAARKKEYVESVGEVSRRLDIRAKELICYAGFLRRLRGRLNEHEDSLTARWEEWLREQQQASLAVAQQREQVAREETVLREQRAEVVRLMGEMRQLRQRPDAHLDPLREENERLVGALAERDAGLAAAQRDGRLRATEAKELQDRIDVLEKVQRQTEPDAEAESEALRRIQVDLETSRRGVDEQIRQLATRYAELERTARDAETEIGRERGRIAQELQELVRLRGEVWAGFTRFSGAETLVDTPSPLRNIPIGARAMEQKPAQEEPASASVEV